MGIRESKVGRNVDADSVYQGCAAIFLRVRAARRVYEKCRKIKRKL